MKKQTLSEFRKTREFICDELGAGSELFYTIYSNGKEVCGKSVFIKENGKFAIESLEEGIFSYNTEYFNSLDKAEKRLFSILKAQIPARKKAKKKAKKKAEKAAAKWEA